jgi:hypothetical protein
VFIHPATVAELAEGCSKKNTRIGKIFPISNMFAAGFGAFYV